MTSTPSDVTDIIEVIQLIEGQQFWGYYAVSDTKTCSQCLNFDMSSMTRREIEDMFPYLSKYSPTLWLPRVHPNCRCLLIPEEDDTVPKPNSLTDNQLIAKIETELVQKYPQIATTQLSVHDKFTAVKSYILNRLSPYGEDDEDLELLLIAALDNIINRNRKRGDEPA